MPLYTLKADLRVSVRRVDLSDRSTRVDLRCDPTRVQVDFEAPPDNRLTWNGVPISDGGEYLVDPD